MHADNVRSTANGLDCSIAHNYEILKAMYTQHSAIETPPDDTIIWRYMDLPKLLALLHSRSLHLCRVDCLRDPWEGRWPQHFLDALLPKYLGARQSSTDPQQIARILKNMPKLFYVNCWHERPYESAALWDQYAESRGIAIRSSIARLKDSLRESREPCFIGRVKYRNYERAEEWLAELKEDYTTPAFLKRESFEHEREVRVLTWPQLKLDGRAYIDWESTTQPGANEAVDLSALIDSVYISPESQSWMVEPMKELLRKFDLPDVVVRRSELYDRAVL